MVLDPEETRWGNYDLYTSRKLNAGIFVVDSPPPGHGKPLASDWSGNEHMMPTFPGRHEQSLVNRLRERKGFFIPKKEAREEVVSFFF